MIAKKLMSTIAYRQERRKSCQRWEGGWINRKRRLGGANIFPASRKKSKKKKKLNDFLILPTDIENADPVIQKNFRGSKIGKKKGATIFTFC